MRFSFKLEGMDSVQTKEECRRIETENIPLRKGSMVIWRQSWRRGYTLETSDGKRLGRISPFWPIVRLTCGLHSCRTEGDFLSARVPTRGVPPIIILDRLGQGSADVTTLPHVRERDRTIKRSTRMELSSKSRMRLMGEGPP